METELSSVDKTVETRIEVTRVDRRTELPEEETARLRSMRVVEFLFLPRRSNEKVPFVFTGCRRFSSSLHLSSLVSIVLLLLTIYPKLNDLCEQ